MAVTKERVILNEVFASRLDAMGSSAAREILRLKFSKAEQQRIKLLQRRWSDGQLNAEEYGKLSSYVQLGNVLTFLHSKARLALKRQTVTRRKSA